MSVLMQSSLEFSYNWNDLSGLACQSMRQLLVVRNEVRDIDIAIVLLYQNILSDLVSVYESIVDLESEDELLERCLNAGIGLLRRV